MGGEAKRESAMTDPDERLHAALSEHVAVLEHFGLVPRDDGANLDGDTAEHIRHLTRRVRMGMAVRVERIAEAVIERVMHGPEDGR